MNDKMKIKELEMKIESAKEIREHEDKRRERINKDMNEFATVVFLIMIGGIFGSFVTLLWMINFIATHIVWI